MRAAGTVDENHAQHVNALEQQLTGILGCNARLKAEGESWSQKLADSTREMGAAKSECSKLSRDIINLKAQVQQSTETAEAARVSLEIAEKSFEEKRRILISEHMTETENIRANMRKASEEAGRVKQELL